MSWLSDALKAAEAIPVVGTPIAGISSIADLASGNTSGAASQALAMIPGVSDLQLLNQATKGAGGGGTTTSQAYQDSNSSSWSPQNQISQFLSLYDTNGATTQQVYNFLKAQYPGNVSNSKNLATALQNFAGDSGWTPVAAGNSSAANIIDPHAVQQFFSQSVAPMMQQVGNNAKSLYNQILSTPNNPNLPSQYNAIVGQGRQNMAQDMLGLSQAAQAAGLAGPQVSTITTMLGNAQKAALQDYYRMLNTSTLTNQGSNFTNLGGTKSNPNF